MKNIAKILGYIAAAVLAACFAVFIDGKIGWFFLTVLAVSVCLSVGLAFFVRRSVRISADVDKTLLYKGEKLILRIRISGIFPFPAGFAAVRVSQCGSFDSENDGCVTVRDRDTMEQERIKISNLDAYIAAKLEF